MTENKDIAKMESSIEQEFAQEFTNAAKVLDPELHQEALTALLKDYKKHIIKEDKDAKKDVKQEDILVDYPYQVSPKRISESSKIAENPSYQSDKIQLTNPKLGEKLMSQQLLECVLVRNVMIYCKPFDQEVIHSFMKVYKYMQETFPHINIYVDDWVLDEITKVKQSELCTADEDDQVCKIDYFPNVFVNEGEDVRESIDFIITLGGDGTILWASKQFRRNHFPPLVSFAHGSLGYMCNFEFKEYK
jgi:hypothetical protein